MPDLLLSRRRALLASLIALAPVRAYAAPRAIEGERFEGSRPDGALGGEGGEGLRLASGQTIRTSSFARFGNGAVRVNKPVDGIRIEDCTADGLYRFLENTASKAVGDASMIDFVIKGITARNLVRGFSRVRYASRDGLFEDIIAMAAARSLDFACGFALSDTASNITYRRCEARGFRAAPRDEAGYWNSDGFSDERGNHAIAYIDCIAQGCSDSGFDTKSQDVTLSGCTASDNKRNFRLWNTGTLSACRSENPVRYGGTGGPAHLAFTGDAPRYTLRDIVISARPDNPAPVFYCETKRPAII
ncbi:MAG: hypothetical protein AAF337_03405, partial [Pseudomonadota bacterium]